jgi:hypothetical protein
MLPDSSSSHKTDTSSSRFDPESSMPFLPVSSQCCGRKAPLRGSREKREETGSHVPPNMSDVGTVRSQLVSFCLSDAVRICIPTYRRKLRNEPGRLPFSLMPHLGSGIRVSVRAVHADTIRPVFVFHLSPPTCDRCHPFCDRCRCSKRSASSSISSGKTLAYVSIVTLMLL